MPSGSRQLLVLLEKALSREEMSKKTTPISQKVSFLCVCLNVIDWLFPLGHSSSSHADVSPFRALASHDASAGAGATADTD